VRRLMPQRQPGRGLALVEVLFALLVFSLALAGGLRAQLAALTATRDTLARGQAVRLLQDLVQRDGLSALAGFAPASLPLPPAASLALPDILEDWRAASARSQAGPPAAVLCITRNDPLLELAITWLGPDAHSGGSCASGSPRVSMLAVLP